MYPLTAVLIGCDTESCPDLRHELLEHGVKIQAEYADSLKAINEMNVAPGKTHLFVIHIKELSDCRQVERLNDLFGGQPIVALLEDSGEETLRQAMRSGAAQVVSLPLRVDDFKDALQRVARQFGYAANASRVIAVSGVSEGCGATTLAINLAAEVAAEHHLPALLVEMTLHLGRLASYLDLNPGYTTHDLLADIDRLDIEVVQQALVRVADNFQVLTGPYKGIPLLKPTPEQVVRMVDYARRLARVVILDMPYTYDDTYFRTLTAADHVVLVATQNVPSLQALKTLRHALEQVEGISNLSVVVNRYDPSHKGFSLKQVGELVKVEQVFAVADDGPHFLDALNAGRTLRQESRSSPALSGIDELANVLLGARRDPHLHHGWHVPEFLRRIVVGGD